MTLGVLVAVLAVALPGYAIAEAVVQDRVDPFYPDAVLSATAGLMAIGCAGLILYCVLLRRQLKEADAKVVADAEKKQKYLRSVTRMLVISCCMFLGTVAAMVVYIYISASKMALLQGQGSITYSGYMGIGVAVLEAPFAVGICLILFILLFGERLSEALKRRKKGSKSDRLAMPLLESDASSDANAVPAAYNF